MMVVMRMWIQVHGKILAICAHQELRAEQEKILIDFAYCDGSRTLGAPLHLHGLLDEVASPAVAEVFYRSKFGNVNRQRLH